MLMTLKEKITRELKNSGDPNIDKMLSYMDNNGYYTCRCSKHNHWQGGAAEHMWAVYLMAKALRDQKLNDPKIAKYATDQKLALVCLLHDLCNMNVAVFTDTHKNVSSNHGAKSKWIMKNLNVGTDVDIQVVRDHMHKDYTGHFNASQKNDEYYALHSLICDADHKAAGTAWNKKRFIERRTQHKGDYTEHPAYLWAVAIDRSSQSGQIHMYMDENYELRQFNNYNWDNIQWNYSDGSLPDLNNPAIRVPLDDKTDVITAARNYTKSTGKRLCIVAGIDSSIPSDHSTRLRQGNTQEQEILICSNILMSFYQSEKCNEKGSKRFRFGFTMRDNIKKEYGKHPKSIYLKDVLMIRDGHSRGLPFVEPWKVDLLLITGKKFDMFAVPSKDSNQQLAKI